VEKSELDLLQVRRGGDDELFPWRVIVISQLLQRTTWVQADRVIGELFELWPDPSAMAAASPRLEKLIRPCGLANQRAARLREMSGQYSEWEREDTGDERALPGPPPELVKQWAGCGPYVLEAYRLIVRGEKFTPVDKKLRWAVELEEL
jgi:endonuclease III